MGRPRAGLCVAAAVVLLGGCASTATSNADARGSTSTAIATFTAPVTTGDPEPTADPVRTNTIRAVCDGLGTWSFGFSPVQAASGNRYLTVQVRNCGDRAAVVPAHPRITTRDADEDVLPVHWEWRPTRASRTVPAGQDAWLQLHWLSGGRCDRGAASIDIRVGSDAAQLSDCLQLGGLAGVTGETASGDAVWSATSSPG